MAPIGPGTRNGKFGDLQLRRNDDDDERGLVPPSVPPSEAPYHFTEVD